MVPSVSDEILFQLDAPLNQLFNITASEGSANYGDNKMHFTLLDWKTVEPVQLMLVRMPARRGVGPITLVKKMCIALVF